MCFCVAEEMLIFLIWKMSMKRTNHILKQLVNVDLIMIVLNFAKRRHNLSILKSNCLSVSYSIFRSSFTRVRRATTLSTSFTEIAWKSQMALSIPSQEAEMNSRDTSRWDFPSALMGRRCFFWLNRKSKRDIYLIHYTHLFLYELHCPLFYKKGKISSRNKLC